VLAAPLLLFARWRLFVPPDGIGALYLLAWSCVAYIAWTAMLLTYAAWGAELPTQYHERSRVTAIREGFLIASILLAASLPAVTGVKPESREALALVFQLMLMLMPITLVMLLVSARERPAGRQASLPFAEGLRLALANRPFRRLIAAFFLNGITNGLPATLFILYMRQILRPEANAGRRYCSTSSAECWECRSGRG
jgi:GPH family glycoside/pentoside/hexuronide:cation symporter